MKEYDAKVRLNEEDGGKTGELDIMSKPPFDKGYFKGVTYGIKFKDPVFEAEKKSGWIPCSERVPKESGYYLVQTDGSHNSVIDIAEFGRLWSKSCEDFGWGWNKASRVIAWMPLPKPYKMGE
jgi:hypothetical protein